MWEVNDNVIWQMAMFLVVWSDGIIFVYNFDNCPDRSAVQSGRRKNVPVLQCNTRSDAQVCVFDVAVVVKVVMDSMPCLSVL